MTATISLDLPNSAIATPTVPLPPGVDTVLLGLDDVVVRAPWQQILTAPILGLADTYELSSTAVHALGASVTDRFLRAPSSEADWWATIEWVLGRDIEPAVRTRLAGLATANPDLDTLLDVLAVHEVTIGTLADVTSFWYDYAMADTSLGEFVDEGLEFLSHRYGRTIHEGLLGEAALACDPATTMVVSSHLDVVEAARREGFHALAYSFA